MREANDAPVDTMGCGVPIKPNLPKEVQNYHTLVSLMMSSQTKDEVTFSTLKSLVEDHDLSVDVVLSTPE